MVAMVMVSNYFDGYSNLMLDVGVVSIPKDIDAAFRPNVESHSYYWHLAYYFWTKLCRIKENQYQNQLNEQNEY